MEWKHIGAWAGRACVLVPLLGVLSGDSYAHTERRVDRPSPVAPLDLEQYVALQQRLQDFSSTFPECAVSVRDPAFDHEIFSYLGDVQFSAASTVKSLIGYAVVRSVEQGNVPLDQTVYVRTEHIAPGSGIGLGVGEYELSYLLRIMISHSDNSAANALIDLFGTDIHSVIDELGLGATEVSRLYFGDDADGSIVTSAQDLTRLYGDIYLNLAQIPHSDAKRVFYDAVAVRQTSLLSGMPGFYFGKYGQNGLINADAGILYTPERALTIAVACPPSDGLEPFSVFSSIFSRTYAINSQ